MNVGIIMLVHTAFGRAEQAARHWAEAGCPVVIHVDKHVPKPAYDDFVRSLSDLPHVEFSKRYRCEWGTWGIVAASQSASELLLDRFAHIRHVYLMSGACLPLRPVGELVDYLAKRPHTDFIESVTSADVPWTMGGLDYERFTLRFPFAWKRQRFLFDRYVQLQRRLGVKRKLPKGIVPHMGSQWWCLTRQTLSAILTHKDRRRVDRYFRRVWIPDESYYQTMTRQFSVNIESRSLTLSKFDYQGRPHVFYDDHLQLLRRSDCFVARKIWPHANRLYDTFLAKDGSTPKQAEPNPGKIDRIFSKAVERRTRGRPGLYMHSRFPKQDRENGATAGPYSLLQGFAEVFEDFAPWLSKATGTRVHGHLFAPDRVEFADGQTCLHGALSDSPRLRDYNPDAFLTNLIWNTRGERQCFQFGPADTQDINWRVAKDPNAQISVITGAWAVPLFRSDQEFSDIRAEAARLQKIESNQLDILRSPWTRARIRIWSLAEFVDAPMEPLQIILDEIGQPDQRRVAEVPKMVDLTGFGQFLQNLKNQGMQPYLMGDFPVDGLNQPEPVEPTRPYLVQ